MCKLVSRYIFFLWYMLDCKVRKELFTSSKFIWVGSKSRTFYRCRHHVHQLRISVVNTISEICRIFIHSISQINALHSAYKSNYLLRIFMASNYVIVWGYKLQYLLLELFFWALWKMYSYAKNRVSVNEKWKFKVGWL